MKHCILSIPGDWTIYLSLEAARRSFEIYDFTGTENFILAENGQVFSVNCMPKVRRGLSLLIAKILFAPIFFNDVKVVEQIWSESLLIRIKQVITEYKPDGVDLEIEINNRCILKDKVDLLTKSVFDYLSLICERKKKKQT